MTLRLPIVAACAGLVLAGCGAAKGPKLDRADARSLIALAQRIAHEGACGQARDIPRLQSAAIRLVNRGRVPRELQEPLMSGVNALAAEVPVCLPPPPAAGVGAPPEVAHPPKPPKPHGHDHGHGPGHGHDGEGE